MHISNVFEIIMIRVVVGVYKREDHAKIARFLQL